MRERMGTGVRATRTGTGTWAVRGIGIWAMIRTMVKIGTWVRHCGDRYVEKDGDRG